MDFSLSDAQRAWLDTARRLARDWTDANLAPHVAASAQAAGLFGPDVDVPTRVLVVEAVGAEHPVGAVTLALQMAVDLSLTGAVPLEAATGRAVALSSEQKPALDGTALNGRALWVGPMGEATALIVGATQGDDTVACAVAPSAAGISVEPIAAAGL